MTPPGRATRRILQAATLILGAANAVVLHEAAHLARFHADGATETGIAYHGSGVCHPAALMCAWAYGVEPHAETAAYAATLAFLVFTVALTVKTGHGGVRV